MKRRALWLASIPSALVLAQAQAASIEQAWEAEGFKAPESAVYDADADAVYVSNVNGGPGDQDGNGFISKITPDGEVTTLEWVTGLDAPKGMVLVEQRLYVSDIDELVVIDVKSVAIIERYPAEGAKFLNDVTADDQGRVFVSDMIGNAIWMLDGDSFSSWLEGEGLEYPNGLLAQDGKLIVGSWGKPEGDFSTKVPGHLKVVDIESKEISPLGTTDPMGNLDGVEPDGHGGYTVTDWLNGAIYHVSADGEATQLMDLNQGSADHEFIEEKSLILVPMMMDGKVVGYSFQH